MPENTMSAFELIHRPVLGAFKPLEASRIRLAPLPEGAIMQVIGPADGAASVAEAAQQARLSQRPNGPGQWFLVSDVPLTRAVIDALGGNLGEGFVIVDQSHGRIRIAVEGAAVEDVLAKGTGVDLAAFAVGHATNTLVGHISVHLSRLSATRFELMSLRGFAESLWHDLQTMAAEFSDPHHH
jgi:sarcosine oxidase subunit gamma